MIKCLCVWLWVAFLDLRHVMMVILGCICKCLIYGWNLWFIKSFAGLLTRKNIMIWRILSISFFFLSNNFELNVLGILELLWPKHLSKRSLIEERSAAVRPGISVFFRWKLMPYLHLIGDCVMGTVVRIMTHVSSSNAPKARIMEILGIILDQLAMKSHILERFKSTSIIVWGIAT